MALAHSTTVRNLVTNTIMALLNGGRIQLKTAAAVVAATLPLANPAAASASAGAAAITNPTPDSNAAGDASAVTIASFQNSSNVEQFTCSVGVSGADINLSGVIINPGDSVTITGLTYTSMP